MTLIRTLQDLHTKLTAEFNAQPNKALQEPIKNRLRNIERKLRLLRSGQLEEGVCFACGEDIPSARLQIVPEACECTSCAQAKAA